MALVFSTFLLPPEPLLQYPCARAQLSLGQPEGFSLFYTLADQFVPGTSQFVPGRTPGSKGGRKFSVLKVYVRILIRPPPPTSADFPSHSGWEN